MSATGLLPRPRILLVDDDPDLLEALSFILDDDGWQVMTVGNGLEAQRVDASQLTMAIVDVTLPGVSGLEVVKSLLKQRAGLPIVLMSGFDREFCKLPPTPEVRWLGKPFDVAELLAILARFKPTPVDVLNLPG